MLKFLFIGDIVGRPGREIVNERLPRLRREHGLDFVIGAFHRNIDRPNGLLFGSLLAPAPAPAWPALTITTVCLSAVGGLSGAITGGMAGAAGGTSRTY